MAETSRLTSPSMSVRNSNPGSIVLAAGTVALDGTNPTPVACASVHGINTVLGAVACFKDATAPGLDYSIVTVDWTGSTLNIYGWEVTGSGDATLVASNATDNISYIVWGTV